MIIAAGLALGKIRVMGISLGIAFVFFAGIVAGNIGMSIDGVTLDYAETFGLSMFVYCLGLHVGPNFFGSLRHEGMMLNVWSLAVIVLGTVFALVLSPLTGISIPVMTGLLCGATTQQRHGTGHGCHIPARRGRRDHRHGPDPQVLCETG